MLSSVTESPNTRRTRAPSTASVDSTLAKQKRKSSSLPSETVEYLKNWMMSPEHIAHPYPTEREKLEIMEDTGIELKQLTNWFVNNRKRFWKPRVEARLQQQAQVAARVTSTVVARQAPLVSPTKVSSAASYHALDMTRPLQLGPRRLSVSPSEDMFSSDNGRVHVVNSEGFASFDRSGSPRAVSIGSTCSGSESDSSSVSTEMDEESCGDVDVELDTTESQTLKRNDNVDIHILRPMGDDPIPTIEDVTILTDIPSNRILRSYKDCPVSYRLPFDGFSDTKKSRNRRDAEVVKIKKQYLKRFLSETAAAAAGLPSAPEQQESPRKRSHPSETEEVHTRRPKYLKKCINLWREACQSASDGYDRELPSLEEASHLFGFVAQ